MCTSERIERSAQDRVAGGTANAGIEADLSFLLYRVPAGFGIAMIEITAQQSLEMRKFQLDDWVAVRCDAFADRQVEKAFDDLFDRSIDCRGNDRPRRGQNRTDRLSIL